MNIPKGSRLLLQLAFVDRTERGMRTPINLGAITSLGAEITRPDGVAMVSPPSLTIVDGSNGIAKMAFPADALDQAGKWEVQGVADGYRSQPAYFLVR